MPSEITAFLQTHTQTRTLQRSNAVSDMENSQHGLFDAFMSEYTSSEENTTDPNAVINTNTHEDTTQLITFKGSNSFSQSVIDILAELNEDGIFTQEIPEKINDIIDTLKDSEEGIHDDIQSIISRIKAVISEKISALNYELPDDIDSLVSQILNDESIPEDTKQEIMNAVDEIVNGIKDSDFVDENMKSLVLKVSDVIHEHINTHTSVSDNDDASDDTEDENIDNDNAEVRTASFNTLGAAVIPLVQQNTDTDSVRSDTVIESESTAQSEISQMNHSSQQNIQFRNVSNESKPVTQKLNTKPQNESETEDVNHEMDSANFDEHLEHADTENDTSNQNAQARSQNQNNNPSGHEENSSEHENNQTNGTQNTSRSRNDTRRTSGSSSLRSQNERTENSHRTESRNTFQSFFEGVLSTRRNASQASALPLNLRTASYSLNQSQTLRDGMINVVRFIRADGVQKANVVVDPPALGRISVELSSTSSGVEASIKVASEQIRQLVQDQLSELRMNLSQQGVQVAEFTVDVQQDNSQNGNHQGGQYGNERRTFAISEADDETEEFRIDLEEGLLYWVA